MALTDQVKTNIYIVYIYISFLFTMMSCIFPPLDGFNNRIGTLWKFLVHDVVNLFILALKYH